MCIFRSGRQCTDFFVLRCKKLTARSSSTGHCQSIIIQAQACNRNHSHSGKRSEDAVWVNLSFQDTIVSLEQGLLPRPSFPSLARIICKFAKSRNEAHILRLFSFLHKHELDVHELLGDCIISMLVEIGKLCDAQTVFGRLSSRNAHAWNVLIMGNIRYGKLRNALLLYQQTRQDGSIRPTEYTIVALLKACTKLRDIREGRRIHDDISEKGFLQSSSYICSTLIDMYAKCGLFPEAQEVLDVHPVQDVVAWTSLLAGFAQHNYGREAVNCFRQMQQLGIFPNALTFACILKACGDMKDMPFNKEVHACIETQGLLETNQIVGNALVDMYAKCGMLERAQEAVEKLPSRDVVTWNTLITGYSDHEQNQEALSCLKQMRLENIRPNAITLTGCLKACGNMKAIEKVRELHDEIKARGFLESDLLLGSTLIATYARCGSLTEALEVFNSLPVRDEVSWTALINGYVLQDCFEEALKCFGLMKAKGVSPDVVTYMCSLKACGYIGAADMGTGIHNEIEKGKLLSMGNNKLWNVLVDMYTKCGMARKAEELFYKISVHDIISWTSLITGYAQLGEVEKVVSTFEKMRGEDHKPNSVTLMSVFVACDNAGLVDEAHLVFKIMDKEYGISPMLEHHTCLVDILARAGQLERAVLVANVAPFLPNIVMWLSVLGACKKWSNLPMAQGVFQYVMELDEMEDSAYVCMANVHVHSGV